MASVSSTLSQELVIVRGLIGMLAFAGIFILFDLYFELITRIGEMHAVIVGDGEMLQVEAPSA